MTFGDLGTKLGFWTLFGPVLILADVFECVQFLKDGIAKLNVPYSYGFAIILLTILVKLATFPLTKKQVRSYTFSFVLLIFRARVALFV